MNTLSSVSLLSCWLVSQGLPTSVSGQDQRQAVANYVAIEHVGQQDKSVDVGIITMSAEGTQSLCGPRHVRCLFILLARREFDEVVGFMTANARPDGGDRRDWPRGYAPFYGTFEVRWKMSEAEKRTILSSDDACSYFNGLGHLSVGQSSASLKKYLAKVRAYVHCADGQGRSR
jgi:hypothetical protein